MKAARTSQKPSVKGSWETTGEKRLLRHRHSGQYYFRYKVLGKQKWICLKTDVKTTAVLRMMDKLKKVMAQRGRGPRVVNANATMGELMDTYLDESRANAELRPSTVASHVTDIKKIEKTWPHRNSAPDSHRTRGFAPSRFVHERNGKYVPPAAAKSSKNGRSL